jgi:hypothetical protein
MFVYSRPSPREQDLSHRVSSAQEGGSDPEMVTGNLQVEGVPRPTYHRWVRAKTLDRE